MWWKRLNSHHSNKNNTTKISQFYFIFGKYTYRKDSENSTTKKIRHSPPGRTQAVEVGHFSFVDTGILAGFRNTLHYVSGVPLLFF